MKKLMYILNLPMHVGNHLFGQDHSTTHRKVSGLLVMVFGVVISKGFGYLHIEAMHYIGETLGFAIHGLGLAPWIPEINSAKQRKTRKHQKNDTRKQSNCPTSGCI